MGKAEFRTVDEYIKSQPAATQIALSRVRRAILRALPKAQEVISYNMPAYLIEGRRVIYFAAWGRHYSIYGATGGAVAAFKAELEPYEVGKGTIRFSLLRPVPAKLIEGIARFRLTETSADVQRQTGLRGQR
jgi:uncharacterized protein YdhG (YjbR/CyaY superfamily)